MIKEGLEFIEEVDKLLKYCTEMRAATNYKGGIKPNIQFIRNFILKVKRRNLEDEHYSKDKDLQ